MVYEVAHFIHGIKVSVNKRQLDLYNPANNTLIGHVDMADAALVDQAVQAAKKAFLSWSKTSVPQRAKIMFRFKALLDQHQNELAEIVTREHGKTLSEAAGSVQRGIEVVDFACGITSHLKGAIAENISPGIDCYSWHQPLGVCVGITPFNFPAMIPLWMMTMAVACGNTFVLKPSERDPSCAMRLVEIAKEAGIPDGVINVVNGDKEAVDALLIHPDVKAVSFVGSSAVAEHIYKTGIANGKRVQAFGGAKNHCIVMPDADITQAANAIAAAAYGCAGERCMALSVAVTVGDQVADQLIEKIKAHVAQIKIGAGTECDIDMGPLITQQHWQRVKDYIEQGKKEGATLLMDGSDYKPDTAKDGHFMGFSLFDHVTPTMKIYQDEIFGPVLCIVRVKTFAEALQLINDHQYGNGTAIFTNSGYIARQFAEDVQVGMVGINVPVPVPVAYQSFGGWKRSIFADIGMYGHEAVRFYTKLKTITERWFAEKKV